MINFSIKLLKKSLLLILLFTLSNFAIAKTEVETFKLKNIPASEMANYLADIVDKETVIRAHGFMLIVRTSDDKEMEIIKELIAKLDVKVKELMIRVHHGKLESEKQANYRISTKVRRTKANDEQSIRVRSGSVASISELKQVPVVSYSYGGKATSYYNKDTDLNLEKSDTAEQLEVQLENLKIYDETQSNIDNLSRNLELVNEQLNNFPLDQALLRKQALIQQQLTDEIAKRGALRLNIPADREQIVRNIKSLENKLAVLEQATTPQKRFESYEGGLAIDYKKLPTGIYVRPILLDSNTVNLEVTKTFTNDISNNKQKINTQVISTSINIQLDSWHKISGENSKLETTTNQIYYSTRKNNDELNDLWIKVEALE